MIFFWSFLDFLIYLPKYFWSIQNSPKLIFQLFCGHNVNKKKKLAVALIYLVKKYDWGIEKNLFVSTN